MSTDAHAAAPSPQAPERSRPMPSWLGSLSYRNIGAVYVLVNTLADAGVVALTPRLRPTQLAST